jgi:uncharacterized membrane protein YphA (DoxX/SURF4 family)
MQSTSFIEPQSIAGQKAPGSGKLKRFAGNFVSAGLAALAVYVFIVDLPLWVFWPETYYEFLEKLDPIAGGVIVVIGALAAARLEAKKYPQAEVEKCRYWMQVSIRYTLAYIFLLYGFAKIFGGQFSSLPVTLDTPLREISGIQLTWRFFGYSYAYTLFVASGQIVGSLLLFFRRTTTIATLILLPIIINIVFLNFTHNIPVRLYSCIFLLLTFYLVLLDYRKLKSVLWDNRPFPGPGFTPLLRRRSLVIGKSILVAVLVLGAFGENLYSAVLDKRSKSPLQGTWEVDEYRVNDVPVEYDSQKTVWRKVYFEYAELAAVRTDQPKPRYLIPTIDSERKTISLTDQKTEELYAEGVYELPADGQMILQLSKGEERLQVILRKLP